VQLSTQPAVTASGRPSASRTESIEVISWQRVASGTAKLGRCSSVV